MLNRYLQLPPSFGRRCVLRGLTAAGGAALAMPRIAGAGEAAQQAKVSVGAIPWTGFSGPVAQYMINNRLFEKNAADLGYELTVDWRNYPTALPMVDAIVSNNLDIGMWGIVPIVRAISANLPLSLLVVGEGHLRLVLVTKQGSPVRNLQDLRGKTVGALLGGDPYFALLQMMRYELGSADFRAAGIRIVNTPTLAMAASVPSGMDAASTVYPSYLAAQGTGTVGVMNSFGYTEPYYKGPLGEGEGILLPTVKQSPFYPEGYYLHRAFWIANNNLLDKQPQLALAFILAQQQAVSTLAAMDPGAVSQIVREFWQLDPEQGGKVVRENWLYRRGWAWPTESDAWAVLKISEFMANDKMVARPLGWDQVKGAFARTSPLLKQAYDRLGGKPEDGEFVRADAPDLRGPPVWEMDRWAQRS
jgi:ABC-type nitrate/sulfonate/bicarbonate transport system substrate-binding protein